ncbi:MAG TPA: ABC transporter permease [Puia sp.]|nr:ABC transporter permease [Puia sp.]
MLKSYFKTAYRFLLRNRTFSFINIFGLAAGMLCCLYIVVYVRDQFSYDKHHKDAGNIYRLTTDLVLTGDKHHNATASPPIAPAIARDFPEVEQFTRVVATLGLSKHLLKYKEKSFYEDKEYFVDSTFFEVFSYHFVDGKPAGALNKPYSMVLLKPVADKLFGTEDPIGKVVTIDDGYGKTHMTVTGVVDESLGKSHIEANLFITMRSGGIGDYVLRNTMWAGNNFAYEYLKIRPDASAAALEGKLPAFLNKYGADQLRQIGMQKQLRLQPLTAIHTSSGYEIDMGKTTSASFLYLLLLIAILIQVVACINFMNLSTARASLRAKEIGVRKVIGAGRGLLIRQFLTESLFLSLLAMFLAVPLLAALLPFLNDITGADVPLTLFADYRLWLLLAGVTVVTGLVAGSYPAFYLSAFQVMKVLKGNFTNQVSAAGIRRGLVVFQFVLSIVLISGIIVIHSQLDFVRHKDLGFDKEQRLVFSLYTDDAIEKIPTFMTDLRQFAEVRAVSQSNFYPSQLMIRDHGVHLAGGNMATAVDVQNMSVDQYYIPSMGLRLESGRDFLPGDSLRLLPGGAGSGKVIINETLARRLGLSVSKAPGTLLYWEYPPEPQSSVEIVGVVKDFNYNSLKSDINPFMMLYSPNGGDLANVVVATSSTDYQQLLGRIQTAWKRDFNGFPFEYAFLDAEVQRQYETEITLGRIISSFTLIAIVISCLGLFGLAAFSAEQRVKEIGIRKVLGAGVPGIVGLLSKDFLKLVLISLVIATPVAWWATDKWLQSFVYRVPLSWWMFGAAGLLAIVIALVTVSFQATKAALANPVKSLRSTE